MSISYEEALSTLQAMFGEPWTRETLDTVLRHFQGYVLSVGCCLFLVLVSLLDLNFTHVSYPRKVTWRIQSNLFSATAKRTLNF